MPRKPTQYTWEFPYHLVSKVNNGDWFGVPMDICWEIYCEKLNHLTQVYDFQVHDFLLMSNHSHLIGTPSEQHYLGEAMHWLQTSVARTINREAGHTNHVFGKRYHPSLITDPYYFAHATRYLFQNPVRAGICSKIEDYPFSTFNQETKLFMKKIEITPPTNGIDHLLKEMNAEERLIWLNEIIEANDREAIRRALSRAEFRLAKPRGSRKDHWMKSSLRKK